MCHARKRTFFLWEKRAFRVDQMVGVWGTRGKIMLSLTAFSSNGIWSQVRTWYFILST